MKLLDRAPRWDQHRDIFLKVGLLCSLIFILSAFNYTSYTTKQVYELDMEPTPEVLEVVPPRIKEKKAIPPPPKPKLEIAPILEPVDDIEFVENTPPEKIDDANTDVLIDDNVKIAPTVPVVDIITPVMSEEEAPVIFAERMPVYNTCDVDMDEPSRKACTQEKMLKHIYSRLQYPSIARENNITGMVVVSFVIDKKGEVTTTEIMKDIGGGCGQAVVDAVNKINEEDYKFVPGKQRGKPLRVQYNYPFKFVLY